MTLYSNTISLYDDLSEGVHSMLGKQIHAIADLSTLMKCHRDSCSWTDCLPVALFRADGFWCTRYASGNW